jgi:hypothetical protein
MRRPMPPAPLPSQRLGPPTPRFPPGSPLGDSPRPRARWAPRAPCWRDCRPADPATLRCGGRQRRMSRDDCASRLKSPEEP